MRQASRVLLVTLFVTGAVAGGCTGTRDVSVGFWFEPITYDATEVMTERLGGPLSNDDLTTIAAVARREFVEAFAAFPIRISDNRRATYRVRVVQELSNAMRPKYPGPAGETRVVPGLGGQSAVSFRAMVSSAVVYAPPGTDRAGFLQAIGRGVGRTAVHELAHQLLGSSLIDTRDDPSSYEYRSADRPEHFYGTLGWTTARPLLERRFGKVASGSGPTS